MNRSTAQVLRAAGLALLAVAFWAQPACPHERPRPPTADRSQERTISMGVGKSIIIDLPQDAAEIFVGNPKVANAIVRTARKLYIVAIDNGQTSIFAMDQSGRQIATFQISVGRDVGSLQEILRTALPNDAITARTVGDTIILTGTVASAGDAQQAVDIAQGFVGTSVIGSNAGNSSPGSSNSVSLSVGAAPAVKGQVVNALVIKDKDQVMLKVSVVEIRRTILKELGVSTTGTWSTGSFGLSTPLSLDGSTANLTNTFHNGKNSLTETLQAFERYGVLRTIAEPTVTAVSGETAKFTAGGEIPVPTSETCTPVTSGSGTVNDCTVGIAFKQYGVTLNFTPVVLSTGRIVLRIATEVTEIDPDQTYSFTNVTVNGFRTRKHETTVELPSGGSIVSAGLLQTSHREVIAGLPGLMNLPVLGSLFRSRDYQREETELMIAVTPYIARPIDPKEVTRPDQGYADATDPQGVFLGRVNKLYSTTSNPQALQNFKGKLGFIDD